MPTSLDELEGTVARVAAGAGVSVVRIGRGPGRGAGVVIDPGRVLTNAHNVRGAEVTVTFSDGRSATANVAGIDAEGDLAVLSVETGDVPAIRWEPERSAATTPGSPVFALASIAGQGLRVTFGLVSAVGQAFVGPRGRTIGGSIEHTAPLGRGSSGGPIVDANGSLLGINTSRLGDGFYLALPTDRALKARVDALTLGDAPTRPRLGVALAPVQAARRMRAAVGLPPRDGLLVRAVEEQSPAAAAGIRQGDLIVAVGTVALSSPEDLHAALDDAAGSTLTLAIVRATEDLEVTVTFP
ncbi:MAG: hypothetical protein NVSMB4_05490 [Acidimicrobiales bacterium]